MLEILKDEKEELFFISGTKAELHMILCLSGYGLRKCDLKKKLAASIAKKIYSLIDEVKDVKFSV